MGITPANRRLTAWIACLAMLFAVLAPSVSQAMTTPADAWVEICSAAGIKLMKVGVDGTTAPDAKVKPLHAKHCVFCAHASDAMGPPPVSLAFSVQPVQHFPSLFYQSPRPLPVWSSAQSRAPPFLS